MKHRVSDKERSLRSLTKYLTFVIFTMIIMSLLLAVLFTFGLAYMRVMPTVGASPFGFLFAILSISVAMASFFAYYINDHILKPIRKLSDASKTVATGNFDVRIDLRTDIEELNSTFDNFNNMVTELNSIETLRNDFVANVSHEFKTPLSAIEGYTMLLQDESLSEEERNEYIAKITDNTRRLSALTGDILLISKLDNQTFSTKKKEFRLDEQLREAILTHESVWERKHLDLDIELPEISYTGEESLLLRVWLNLIGNAVKFTPEGGCISVKMTENESIISVCVSDTGIGMDESTSKHIFEKFYQGDTSHKGNGNGLGLALCKKIITRAGGTISVESTPGKGSEFTVKLPK